MKLLGPILSGLCLWLAGALCARAQSVPALVNYQGRLANPDGSPLLTAEYELRFRVYDATNGGNLIWGPQLFDGSNGLAGHGPKIPVVQGYFNAMLGPVDILSNSLAGAFTATNRFVEVSVGANNPILPRQQILSAPFALQAENSAKLAGYDWSAILVGGSNNPVNGRIAGSKIEAGGITAAQIASNSITSDRLALRPFGANVAAGGLAISAPFTQSSGFASFPNYTVVTGLNVTLVTTGRPVFLSLVAAPGSSVPTPSRVQFVRGSGNSVSVIYSFVRDGNPLSFVGIQNTIANANQIALDLPPGAFTYVDIPTAGPHTYSFAVSQGDPAYLNLINVQLVALEF